jgi:hypothetical protein
MDSNDRAVEYLHQIEPAGLDLKPIDMALACRQASAALKMCSISTPTLTAVRKRCQIYFE